MKVLFPFLVYQYFKTVSSIDFYLRHFLLHLFLFRFDILILLRAVIKYSPVAACVTWPQNAQGRRRSLIYYTEMQETAQSCFDLDI